MKKFNLFASAALAVLLTACGTSNYYETTCGTTTVPPIAAEGNLCGSQTAGYRWYTAARSDVSEPDERPIVGQELDGDWWDPSDQNESERKVNTGRATTSAKPTPKPGAATQAAKPTPSTRPTKPSSPSTTPRR